MNLQYVKYALEVARTGSISKAAENLSVAQPNLSRAIKELEGQMGIVLFDRTRTGMTVTPEGERFLSAGERILRDVSELETMFGEGGIPREGLTVTLPHASYLSEAFALFCNELPIGGRYDVVCRSGGAVEAIGDVQRGESRLGVIRYAKHFERYYTDLLAAKELAAEPILEFRPVILCGGGSPLVLRDTVATSDLVTLHEILCEDSLSEGEGVPLPDRRITAEDRAMRYDLLVADPTAYLCTSPMTPGELSFLGLCQRPMAGTETAYCDVFIYPKAYRLSPLDRRLLANLRERARTIST